METWLFIVTSLCVAAVTGALLFGRKNLPPGPSFLSSNFIILTNSILDLESILRNFKSKYGPLITLFVGSHPSIFIGSHSLAHEILIQKGAVFSDRPRNFVARNINSAAYGPTWRLLRRNLATQILHPSRVMSYSWARKWVLHTLIRRLQQDQEETNNGIKVFDHFQYAMYSLLVFMCFGEKLDEDRINEIATVQRRLLLAISSGPFNVLGLFPKAGMVFFINKLKEILQIRKDQEDVLTPLIKSRIESVLNTCQQKSEEQNVAYVDTLVNLRLPEEEADNENGGKLNLKEMVDMCAEFLSAGVDTTSTALQWIMANLVKYPHIQIKLYDEIVEVVGQAPPPLVVEPESMIIKEEDLGRIKYLKAVVLEGLRRHPPGHFVLPHRVSKEVKVQGYTIPEGATINFMVGEMGLDPKVWDDPMEFKPERFLDEQVFDISGSKGIKMMPFGAGRRICPGYDLALLHLEYFVANLIWYFHWTTPDGYDVDLSEKLEFTVVMKEPLQSKISPRVQKRTT